MKSRALSLPRGCRFRNLTSCIYLLAGTRIRNTQIAHNNSDQRFASVGSSGVECKKKEGSTPGANPPAMAEYWQQNQQQLQQQPQQQQMLTNGVGGASVARDESASACNGVGRAGNGGGGSVASVSGSASATGNNNNNYVNFNQFITQHNLASSSLGYSIGGGGGAFGLMPNSSSSSSNSFGGVSA